ncbi:MAG: alpha/beta hydrolase domain-containing protein, partial [Novosphingobium sp.]
PLNLRFGVPGGAARAFEPGSEGTLWWSPYNDRVRGLGTTSLLDRCTLSNTCPKVIETFGSAEFWGLRMAPGLIGTDAAGDVPLPANVRRYYFPSVTHGGSWTGGFKPAGDGAVPGCKLPGNPNPSLESLYAAQAMLVDWVRSGTAPKPSAYPTLAGGELVPATAEAMGWRGVPGTPDPARMLNRMPDYRFGKAFRARDVSGSLSTLPPEQRGTIPQLVPRVNDDGNETAGIPSVQLQVPLGSYLGWNETTTGFDAGSGC